MNQCPKCLEPTAPEDFAVNQMTKKPRLCCQKCVDKVKARSWTYKKKEWQKFICHQCNKNLPAYRFGRKKANIYGLDYVCKRCRAQNEIENPTKFEIY